MKETYSKKIIQKNKNFYYWIGVISDILIYPIILLSLLCSFAMFSSKKQNEVPSIFGISIVQVLTKSMTADNFYPGNNVIVKEIKTDDLRVDDIVAFYYAQDAFDNTLRKTVIQDKKNEELFLFDNLPFADSNKIDYRNRKTLNYYQKLNTKVYFHRIDAVYMLEDGVRMFRTKGSSNTSADSYLIREDLIVGKYVETPQFVRSVFSFCTKPIGMIILVIVPLSILICMELLSLLEQINALILERKVLEKRVRYDAEECKTSNITMELRNCDKTYFYDIVKPKHKEAVHDYMWSYLSERPSKRNRLLEEMSYHSKQFYKIGRNVYWQYNILFAGNISKYKYIKKESEAEKFRYEEKNKKLGYEKAGEDL